MLLNKTEIKNTLQNFIEICEKNNIWYSLDNMFLLGVIRHSGFVPWHEKMEVFLTIDSINKLKRLYPKNIVDSTIDKSFDSLTLAWVQNNKKWKEHLPFIQIRIAIPTTLEKVKKFQSIKGKIVRLWKNKHDSYKRAVEELYEPKKYQGFFLPSTRKDPVNGSWIHVISSKVEKKEIFDVQVNVLKEYNAVLENWFGKDFATEAKMPNVWFEYPRPLKRIGVN